MSIIKGKLSPSVKLEPKCNKSLKRPYSKDVDSTRNKVPKKLVQSVKSEPLPSLKPLRLSKTCSKGEWHIVEHGHLKYKKKRKHNCPSVGCDYKGDSTRLLNDHYRRSHPPIKCNDCNRLFSNPSSSRRHSYWHKKSSGGDMFHCNRCEYSCPFESTLRAHKDKHSHTSCVTDVTMCVETHAT